MIKRKNTNQPEISTASLPDIIFMLLFFFMVVTVLKQEQSGLFYTVPTATEPVKLKHSNERSYIFIGRPDEGKAEMHIQINDKFVNPEDLEEIFRQFGSALDVDPSEYEISLKADKNAPMKLIKQVTLSMRKAGLKKINYLVDRMDT